MTRQITTRQIVMQQMRMAAFAVAVTIVLSGMATAYDRDDDDHYRGDATQTRQYGYQNGYNDGLRKGRHEGKENDPYDFRSREWQNADHGYKSWMGPFELFREGYRDGYRAGFESGFQSVRGWYGDRDGDHDGDRWHGENVGFRSPARDIGFEDGSRVARQDLGSGKPFDPYPRSGYANADHGYHSSYGSKAAYQGEYANGYRNGYQSVYRRRD
jgi:hypothetical protein